MEVTARSLSGVELVIVTDRPTGFAPAAGGDDLNLRLYPPAGEK